MKDAKIFEHMWETLCSVVSAQPLIWLILIVTSLQENVCLILYIQTLVRKGVKRNGRYIQYYGIYEYTNTNDLWNGHNGQYHADSLPFSDG